MIIAYYNFVCAFVEKKAGIIVKVGYGAVAFVVFPLVVAGYVPQSVSVSQEAIDISYGPFLPLLSAIGFPFFILSVVTLIKRYKSTKDPLSRNKIMYLLAGLGLLISRTGLIDGLRYTFGFPADSELSVGTPRPPGQCFIDSVCYHKI
jgi:hypothetical protein